MISACAGGAGGSKEPRAAFALDASAGTTPLVVQFVDRSAGPVTSRSWDFGDGQGSSERHPQHVYATAGVFDVSLEVRSERGSDRLVRAAAVSVAARSGPRLEYGMNPSFQRWSSREIVFADAMMRASEFVIARAGQLTQEPAPLVSLAADPPPLGAGWPDLAELAPGETVAAWLFGSMEGTLPDGRVEPWVLTWEGSGDVQLIGSAVIGEAGRRARRADVLVDPEVGGGNGTVALWIRSSSRGDPIRDVHVWLPGMHPVHSLFWAPYVERVQAMNHGRGPATWRTLDWTRVNDHGATDPPVPFVFDLAGAIRPSSPSQGTRRGMCPEFQVAFCNRVGADLHFLVPHRAEPMTPEDYEHHLRDVLTRLRDGAPAVAGIHGGRPFEGLGDDLELTLELSNELWNPGFPASAWFQQRASERGIRVHQAIAEELLLVWRIADEVFAGRRTVRRFVGGWIGDAGFARRILEALPPGTRVDALGCSCYMRPRPERVAQWLVGSSARSCPSCPEPRDVVAAAVESLEELRPLLAAQRALADSHTNPDGTHPALELYEAGQACDAGGEPWSGAAQAAQLLPEMYYAFVDGLVPLLSDSGVELVNWYSFMTDQDPRFGVDVGYGIWNDMGQRITLPVPEPYVDEGAPKAAAIYRGPPRPPDEPGGPRRFHFVR